MTTQSRTAVGRLLERFLRLEAASGIVLLAAATLAIVWANSPMRSSYHHLWELSLGPRTLHFAINEGLMVIFFLVIGLEVRREIHAGELSEPRRAALPVVAALGGMLGPALLYSALNPSLPQRRGWGVPTATDIAFAVGILALLGRRVPSSLRVLLLALAIIDDIGAVLLIAIFYSGGIAWPWLLVALAGVLLVVALQRMRVSHVLAYVPCGVVLWLGLYRAGVHPTMAGVILGLLTPAAGDSPPLTSLLDALHPWVAFGIMPLFALANAGVTLAAIAPEALSVTLGVAVALAVGKPAGVFLAVLAATKLRLVALPRRVTWSGIVTVGVVAGIGFTMSIFIAGLALPSAAHLNAAKIGVLIASFIAGFATLVIGRLALPVPSAPDIGPSEAESSTVE